MNKRIKFFVIYFVISLLTAGLTYALVYQIWYPYPLSHALGVTPIYAMLLVIHVLVCPILGLLVYKENKTTLMFDLGTIFVLHVSALLYGLYSLNEGRPAWVVYNVTRFELIRNSDIITDTIDQTPKKYRQPPWFGFEFVAISYDNLNTEVLTQQALEEILQGKSIARKPKFYSPLDGVSSQIIKASHNLNELKQYNTTKQVDTLLLKYPQADSFVPLKANAVDMTVLIDKKSGGKVVKIVDLRPW